MTIPSRLVYLIGPIAGITYDESTSWHAHVEKSLSSHIHCIAPMRGWSGALKTIGKIKPSYVGRPECDARGIISRNTHDVRSCDLAFANFLGAAKISKGSIWELGVAYALHKPIMVVIEPDGNLHSCPHVLACANWVCHDLDSAIQIVQDLLTPGIC